jgi:hypothetical protein
MAPPEGDMSNDNVTPNWNFIGKGTTQVYEWQVDKWQIGGPIKC